MMTNITPPAEIAEKLTELNTWRNLRQLQYGSMQDQLNMLSDDIAAGVFGEAAKTGKWFLHIQSVKSEIQKPNIQSLEQELKELMEKHYPKGT